MGAYEPIRQTHMISYRTVEDPLDYRANVVVPVTRYGACEIAWHRWE